MISKNREYVLVSWKWSWNKDHLMFWGSQSKDDERRSFGGYTMDVENCEKYTKDELNKENHLFWEGQKVRDLDTDETYAVKLSDLRHFGQRKTIIWR